MTGPIAASWTEDSAGSAKGDLRGEARAGPNDGCARVDML